jgi:hypothetical protein
MPECLVTFTDTMNMCNFMKYYESLCVHVCQSHIFVTIQIRLHEQESSSVK